MKKFLKISAVITLLLAALLIMYINISLPDLPAGANEIINKAVKSELPDLKGQTGYAYNGETKIWYELIQAKDSIKGTVLLNMGISNNALAFPNYFLNPFTENGYQLIRFDNRGTGMTDWMEDWSKENSYSLEDLAADAAAILDKLQIEKVHVFGVSLGGMIAQTFAIEYPERTLSLISMMSSGNIMDNDLPHINTAVIKDLILAQVKYGLIKTEKNEIKLQILARQILQGDIPYEMNIEEIAYATLYNLRKRNGYNKDAFKQQSEATIKSGSRYEALKTLDIPSLIIHGTSDPMIDFAHGKKCFELIPNADNLWLDGLGHDLPEEITEEVVSKIISHMQKADSSDSI
jgi:proline iminopeptidase